jgi:hypothetical protein
MKILATMLYEVLVGLRTAIALPFRKCTNCGQRRARWRRSWYSPRTYCDELRCPCGFRTQHLVSAGTDVGPVVSCGPDIGAHARP